MSVGEKEVEVEMNFFKRFLKKQKKEYTDDELLELSKMLKNKVLILHMDTPYNKIIVHDIKEVKIINDKRYVEFTGYNLNRQHISMIVSDKTYIKLCKSSAVSETSEEDEIYIKDITDESKRQK